MSPVLVGLEEVLVKLKDRGPLPTSAVAPEFGLNALDARILLLDAHLHGLVVRNDWGEWALSARGREALSASESEPLTGRSMAENRESSSPRARPAARRWRSRRAVLAGACAVVCALVAAVPIGLNAVATGAPQPAAHQARAVVAGRDRYVAGRVAWRSRGHAVAAPLVERRLPPSSELRSRVRSASRHATRTLPLRFAASSAKAAAASPTVEMATNQSLPTKRGPGLQHYS